MTKQPLWTVVLPLAIALMMSSAIIALVIRATGPDPRQAGPQQQSPESEAVVQPDRIGPESATRNADRHVPAPERWTPIKFEHEVPNGLVGWFKEILGTDYPIVYTEVFKYAAVSLKIDDKSDLDIITYIEHPDFCSSDGCSIRVYKINSNGDLNDSQPIGAFCSNGQVAFAGTVTNGYQDLINDKADFIVFDGAQYLLRSADRHVSPPERCIGPERAFSRNRHVPPPERWRPIKFEYGVPKAYVGWLKRILGRDFDSAYTKGFKYAEVSLKVDDKSDRDIITYIEQPGFCGSGGCSININKFDSIMHSYKAIGSFFSNGQVAFAGTVTNGYRDLINDKADFIVFDGAQYIESGRPPEPAAAQEPPSKGAAAQGSIFDSLEPKYPFVTAEGAILCQNPLVIKEAKAALAAYDKGWFEQTGCVRAQGGLKVVLIDAPLATSRGTGALTPNSDLPWRGRVYGRDSDAAVAANVYFDPSDISTYAWATIPVPLAYIGPGHFSRGDKPIQFTSLDDAERWYAQKIPSRSKPYVPHKAIDDGNGTFRLLLGPTPYGSLDAVCPSDPSSSYPSCYILGHLPR